MSVKQPTHWLRSPVPAMLALCIALWGCRQPAGTNLVGRPAHDFAFDDLDGNEVKLSKLRGKPVLIDFLASWCVPCAMGAPHMEALHREHADDGLQVIGISLDQSSDDARAFVKEHRLTFPVLWANPSSDEVQEMAEAFAIETIPRTLLIDSKGIVRADLTGLHSPEELMRELKKIGISTEG